MERIQRASGLRPAMRIGSSMFSAAVNVGSRLNDWKMKPISSRRRKVSCLSLRDVRSVSPTYTCPDVGRSRPARTCNRVDFPDPEGPMIGVNLPAWSGGSAFVRRLAASLPLPEALDPAEGGCAVVTVETLTAVDGAAVLVDMALLEVCRPPVAARSSEKT